MLSVSISVWLSVTMSAWKNLPVMSVMSCVTSGQTAEGTDAGCLVTAAGEATGITCILSQPSSRCHRNDPNLRAIFIRAQKLCQPVKQPVILSLIHI